MNNYTILKDGEFFANHESYVKGDDEKILKEFFANNQADIEYLDTDEHGKLTAYTWQGQYTIIGCDNHD